MNPKIPDAFRGTNGDVFGFKVPTDFYYLHRGHSWAVLEESGRCGWDWMTFPKSSWVKLTSSGFLRSARFTIRTMFAWPCSDRGTRLPSRRRWMAPSRPSIPGAAGPRPDQLAISYGKGWLFKVSPANLRQNLEKLFFGEANATWIDQESHRLLFIMEGTVGATLPQWRRGRQRCLRSIPQCGLAAPGQGVPLDQRDPGLAEKVLKAGRASRRDHFSGINTKSYCKTPVCPKLSF